MLFFILGTFLKLVAKEEIKELYFMSGKITILFTSRSQKPVFEQKVEVFTFYFGKVYYTYKKLNLM